MYRTQFLILTAVTLTGMTFAQTSAETQTSTSVSQSTSAQVDRSGAQAQSQTSAQAASQSALSSKAGNYSASAAASNQLASGTSFHSTLEKPVDTRKCKPGDQVIAKNTENVKSNGKVIIPKGSKIMGHVTQVQTASKGQSTSQLGIAFDHALLKSGQEVPMTASIQALAASQQTASAAMVGDGMDDGSLGWRRRSCLRPRRCGRSRWPGRRHHTGGGRHGGSLVNTAASVGGGAGGTLRGAGAGLNASGQLMSSSHGVVGLKGLSLDSATAAAAQGSVVTSRTGNVHLDSGTQMILRMEPK